MEPIFYVKLPCLFNLKISIENTIFHFGSNTVIRLPYIIRKYFICIAGQLRSIISSVFFSLYYLIHYTLLLSDTIIFFTSHNLNKNKRSDYTEKINFKMYFFKYKLIALFFESRTSVSKKQCYSSHSLLQFFIGTVQMGYFRLLLSFLFFHKIYSVL